MGGAMQKGARHPLTLEGEDITTTREEDARHWIRIYADLIGFKIGLLDRVRIELPKLNPLAQKAAAADLKIIEEQMEGYQARLDVWYQRLWDLEELRLDPERRTVRRLDKEETLTNREFQLLQFLLNHPHRLHAPSEILVQAWAEPNLFPERVRGYAPRLRKVLTRLDIPCDLVNYPGRGYSLQISSQ